MFGNTRAASVLCAAILAGCEPPFEPVAAPESQVLVHAVLDLGAGSQTVLLERTQADAQGRFAINGANVTLSTPEGILISVADEASDATLFFRAAVYHFRTSQQVGGLSPGNTYVLRIATQAGDTITGSTTVPNSLPAPSPSVVDTFNPFTDTLRLDWQRVPGARSYQVSVYSLDSRDDNSRPVYTVFADTSIMIPGTARTIDNDRVFFDGSRARVTVVAVDDNYYTYFHASVDPFAGAPASRLAGALGVFGSVVPVVVRLLEVGSGVFP